MYYSFYLSATGDSIHQDQPCHPRGAQFQRRKKIRESREFCQEPPSPTLDAQAVTSGPLRIPFLFTISAGSVRATFHPLAIPASDSSHTRRDSCQDPDPGFNAAHCAPKSKAAATCGLLTMSSTLPDCTPTTRMRVRGQCVNPLNPPAFVPNWANQLSLVTLPSVMTISWSIGGHPLHLPLPQYALESLLPSHYTMVRPSRVIET